MSSNVGHRSPAPAAPARPECRWTDPPCDPPWAIIGSFIDTLTLRLPRARGDDLTEIDDDIRAALDAECGQPCFIAPSPGGPGMPPRHTAVTLYQPGPRALLLADDVLARYVVGEIQWDDFFSSESRTDAAFKVRERGEIQAVECSLEVAAASAVDARRIATYLKQRLRRPYARGPCYVYTNKDGSDGASGSSSKRWAVDRHYEYAGESKLQPGRPCVRVERQLRGTAFARRGLAGVCRPSDVPDLLPTIWTNGSRRLRFEEPDLRALGRQAALRSKAKKARPLRGRWRPPYDEDEEMGALVQRQASIAANEPWLHGSAQTVRALVAQLNHDYKGVRGAVRFYPKTFMVEIPLAALFAGPW